MGEVRGRRLPPPVGDLPWGERSPTPSRELCRELCRDSARVLWRPKREDDASALAARRARRRRSRLACALARTSRRARNARTCV